VRQEKAVIEAAILQAREDSSFAVIESTSNQVDQYGGYTGLRPADFTNFVKSIAASLGFPEERILFGGDHLGPNAWQNESAQTAMGKAKILVRDYVKAGYTKIHLDTSMACADDGGKILTSAVVAERALELCRICEEAAQDMKEKPFYVIGTEVPVPGGALENGQAVRPSLKENLLETLEIHRKIFLNARLWEAWDRVIAIVAQPGVEFSDRTVSYYNRSAASDISHALDKSPLVFEAHSTDYQKPSGLKQLVEDHFCILKVGPWLTFRYREALFSLAWIENELIPRGDDRFNDRSNLEQVLENVMTRSKPILTSIIIYSN
jgi:D-tagatose-1,6-bisphosphate aldolase subunit GatZ/KbaZ